MEQWTYSGRISSTYSSDMVESLGSEAPKTALRLPGLPSTGDDLLPCRVMLVVRELDAAGIDGDVELEMGWSTVVVWKKRGSETMFGGW